MKTQLIILLDNLTQEMQKLDLWQPQPPNPEAFLSEQPFSLDAMEPHEWLQWVFVPRMKALIEADACLPRNFALHPYFEEVYKEQEEAITLLSLLEQIDLLVKD